MSSTDGVDSPVGTAAYGFVGTGSITRAMVEGLSTVDDPPAIVVSPRGAAVSAALARRFANVRVAADNQAVVDAVRCVVLAPRPVDAPAVVEGLRFTPEHVVVSVVAALPLAHLRSAVAPATRVARAIPLPSVAARQGLVPVVPPEPDALELFGRLGDVAALDDETAFDAFSAASAFAATQLDLLATVEAWLAGQGVPAPEARAYVGVLLRGLSDALAEEPDRELAALADDHATPGGLNQQVREDVRAAGTHAVVATALDDVLARVRGARAER
ncbi:NAD(P)-binding domain-containing protein [Microlunatus flavus]|uniref:Pyrroline-5-carboxylate reductase n=1 Tax=Microlunatus flavus TaxID=1036181 RepID=A0A1H9H5V0_9ACTN|nr:NAD(P)-binding domain-containing protein [Microlunatus flavus]SEQ57689.1 pyrroline-5-carboxylate reductase [Microlunatus flavus]